MPGQILSLTDEELLSVKDQPDLVAKLTSEERRRLSKYQTSMQTGQWQDPKAAPTGDKLRDAANAGWFYGTPKPGADAYNAAGPNRLRQGARDVSAGNYRRGAHELITGAGATIAPVALPAGLVNAAIPTLAAMGVGMTGDVAGNVGTRLAGYDDDTANLVGDVTGLAGGYLGAKGAAAGQRVYDSIDPAMRARVRDAVIETASPRARGAIELGRAVNDLRRPAVAAPATTSQELAAPQREVTPPAVETPRAPSTPAPAPRQDHPPAAPVEPWDAEAARASGRADTQRVLAQAKARWAADRAAPPPASTPADPTPAPSAAATSSPKRSARDRRPAAAPGETAARTTTTANAPTATSEASRSILDDPAVAAEVQKYLKKNVPLDVITKRVSAAAELAGKTGFVNLGEVEAKVAHWKRTGKW